MVRGDDGAIVAIEPLDRSEVIAFVERAATIRNQCDVVVHEIGIATGGLDACIGRNAAQQQASNAMTLEDGVELGLVHRAVAMLDHDGLAKGGPDPVKIRAP